MTDLRRKIFDFYKSQIEENGYPPTITEAGEFAQCDPSYVWYTLEYLEKRGYISRKNGKRRAVKILKED